MTFWPRPNMLRFPNRCRILKTTAAKGPSCTGGSGDHYGIVTMFCYGFSFVILLRMVWFCNN